MNLFYLLPPLLVLNLYLFFLMGYDKRRAQKQKSRVPESVLFRWTLLGGAPALFLAMHFWKHKRRKATFLRIAYSIVLFQVILVWLLFYSAGQYIYFSWP